jgi:hypothetical protein
MTSPATSLTPYPVQLELNAPLKVARWRPLVHWLLAIPHFVILYALILVQRVVYIIAWFAILFTGRMPDGLFGFNVMVMRYSWRVTSYLLFMREGYPPFEFSTEGADVGTDPAHLSVVPAAKLSRGLIFVKWLLVIPHYFVLLFLGIAVYFVMIIGFFAVLITGSWPAGLRNYVVGVVRWSNRVTAYLYLLTDAYPPFSLS